MKEIRRKIVSVILVVTLAFGMLVGCSKKEDSKDTKESTIDEIYEETSVDEAATDQETKSDEAATSDSTSEANYDVAYESGSDTTTESYDDSYTWPNENTEEYNTVEENGFVSVLNQPLSTFSADVDTASYSNVRRMIEDGYYFDPDAVRIEEMINYFDYDYHGPSKGEPFGVNVEIADCPWNNDTKLMLVGLQAKEIDFRETPSSNLVFLLDVSGSMEDPDKLPLMQKAFEMLVENLTEKDRISIVTYAGDDTIVLEGARGDEKELIISRIDSLQAGGSTAGSKGIETAYELAESYFIKGGNNRVILATDGDLNVGVTSESDLSELIQEKKESGVFLSVLGFGTENIKDNKMETLADDGNGNYSYIDSIFEAKKVLVDEMGSTLVTVAKDVKFQVEFNQAQVKGYRLIGYENRMLNAEDFQDDTKDAGEIGAGHSVTALYEIVPANSKMQMEDTNLKYQNNVKTDYEDEWLTISVRYKEPDSNHSKLLTYPISQDYCVDRMSSNLQFASCVAEFGMILIDSEYIGYGNMNHLLHRLDKMELRDSYRQEFYNLVRTVDDNNYIIDNELNY
jgi:Ca-activated chloride channel family protein